MAEQLELHDKQEDWELSSTLDSSDDCEIAFSSLLAEFVLNCMRVLFEIEHTALSFVSIIVHLWRDL